MKLEARHSLRNGTRARSPAKNCASSSTNKALVRHQDGKQRWMFHKRSKLCLRVRKVASRKELLPKGAEVSGEGCTTAIAEALVNKLLFTQSVWHNKPKPQCPRSSRLATSASSSGNMSVIEGKMALSWPDFLGAVCLFACFHLASSLLPGPPLVISIIIIRSSSRINLSISISVNISISISIT